MLPIVGALVAALVERGPPRLDPATRLGERQPLPEPLNHFRLRFRFTQ